jgi:hypothetical protein
VNLTVLKSVIIIICAFIGINCQSDKSKNEILYEKHMLEYYHLIDTFKIFNECSELKKDSIQQRFCSQANCFNVSKEAQRDPNLKNFNIRYIVYRQNAYAKTCTNYIKISNEQRRIIKTYIMERRDSLNQKNNIFFQETSGIQDELDENTQEVEKVFFIDKTFQFKKGIIIKIYLSAKLF